MQSDSRVITKADMERLILGARASVGFKSLKFLGENNRLPTEDELWEIAAGEMSTIHSVGAMIRHFYPDKIPSSLLVNFYLSQVLDLSDR